MTVSAQALCAPCASVSTDGGQMPRVACEQCGSTARKFDVHISQNVEIRTSLGMKAKHANAVGDHKWFIETFNGWSLHRDSGEMRKIERVLDRENDRYSETVNDPQGNLIRRCEEPLSQHQGRGDAKRKQ